MSTDLYIHVRGPGVEGAGRGPVTAERDAQEHFSSREETRRKTGRAAVGRQEGLGISMFNGDVQVVELA